MALKLNTTITSMNLEGGRRRASARDEGHHAPAFMRTRYVDAVAGSDIGDAGAEAIAAALKSNTTIYTVELPCALRGGAAVAHHVENVVRRRRGVYFTHSASFIGCFRSEVSLSVRW